MRSCAARAGPTTRSAEELDVSKSSLSLWLRGLPRPAPEQREARRLTRRRCERTVAGSWAPRLAEREQERQAVKGGGRSAQSAGLTEPRAGAGRRDRVLVRGRQGQAWRRRELVSFINSDPDLIAAVLEWLRGDGLRLGRTCRLGVCRSTRARTSTARSSTGRSVLGVDPRTLRAGNAQAPPTRRRQSRKNTGEGYVGCLFIGVRGSRVLYQQIEGPGAGSSRQRRWLAQSRVRLAGP